MRCDKYCDCILCLELKGCEQHLQDNVDTVASNFILAKPDKGLNDLMAQNGKRYTFFGMQVEGDFEKFSTLGKSEIKNDEIKDSLCGEKVIQKPEDKTDDHSNQMSHKHKSVIYVNDGASTSVEDAIEEITKNEYIDEWMSLCSRENSTEINVIFKNTFSLASQIINEVHSTSLIPTDEENEDDFPLGMEAELLKHYMKDRYVNKLFDAYLYVC